MKTVGALVLLIVFALIAVTEISAVNDLTSEAAASNDTEIASGAQSTSDVILPILLMMGFGVLIIGVTIAIKPIDNENIIQMKGTAFGFG